MAVLFTSLALSLGITQVSDAKPRQPHPLAPSLPLLSQAEYNVFERVIDRFIQYDIGELTGAEGKQALDEFKKLGPEAIFSLIDGLNRAAAMPASCPAVIIGKKIAQLLSVSNDVALLDYARENIGSNDVAQRHLGTIKNLRLGVTLRRNAVARAAAVAGAPSTTFNAMPLSDLVAAVKRERGDKLRQVLLEFDRRQGPDVLPALVKALSQSEGTTQQAVQTALVRHLARASAEVLREQFHSDNFIVRGTAAYVAGQRRLPLGSELIGLLDDKTSQVQQAARQALVLLSGGRDFGPGPSASDSERALAVQDWRNWWERQGSKSP